MHKFKMKSKHPVPRHGHPPPTSGEQTPPPTAISDDFSSEPKKKKKIRPLGMAAIHPNG
jgi:hypothetical protein